MDVNEETLASTDMGRQNVLTALLFSGAASSGSVMERGMIEKFTRHVSQDYFGVVCVSGQLLLLLYMRTECPSTFGCARDYSNRGSTTSHHRRLSPAAEKPTEPF